MKALITSFAEIAQYLTHPLILTGFTLMLFFGLLNKLLKSGILGKVSQQASGKIVTIFLRYGFWLALLVVLLGFSLQFYKEQKTRDLLAAIDAVAANQKEPNLQVDFSPYYLEIANTGQGIILVSDISLNWLYEPCKQRILSPKPPTGIVPEFKYEIQLTRDNNFKKIDKIFKYSPGEIDLFRFAYTPPDGGDWVYYIWATFKYKKFNDADFQTYSTKREEILSCE
jgi:hypothetical protein